MLVLGRRRHEAIVIDGDVRVTVVEIRGDQVRLGFEADESIPIHREEVWIAIQKEREQPAV